MKKEHDVQLWDDLIKPIVVLSSLCATMTLALGITNHFTSPVVEQRNLAKTSSLHGNMIPGVDFKEVLCLTPNVTDAYQGVNGEAYIISATVKGYDGPVVATVGFDEHGTIIAIQFQADNETVGIGKNILEPSYGEQFLYLEPRELEQNVDIDSISGATITSTSAIIAVNSCIKGYQALSNGFTGKEELILPEETRLIDLPFLMPRVEAFNQFSLKFDQVIDAYADVSGSGYVIYVRVTAYVDDIIVAVAVNTDLEVSRVKVTSQQEIDGYGSLISERDFLDSFQGYSGNVNLVDVISSATTSSFTVIGAVDIARDAVASIKEITKKDILDTITITEENRTLSSLEHSVDTVSYTEEEMETLRLASMRQIMPLANDYTPIPLDMPQVIDVFKAEPNYGYIITATGYGKNDKEMTIMIGIKESGEISALRQFLPNAIARDKAFMNQTSFFVQFFGLKEETSTDEIDIVSNATYSSEAIVDVVNVALRAYAAITNSEENLS